MKSKDIENPWLIPLLAVWIPGVATVVGTILGPLFLSVAKDPSPVVLDQYGGGDPAPFKAGAAVGLCLGIVIAVLVVTALYRGAARPAYVESHDDDATAAAH